MKAARNQIRECLRSCEATYISCVASSGGESEFDGEDVGYEHEVIGDDRGQAAALLYNKIHKSPGTKVLGKLSACYVPHVFDLRRSDTCSTFSSLYLTSSLAYADYRPESSASEIGPLTKRYFSDGVVCAIMLRESSCGGYHVLVWFILGE